MLKALEQHFGIVNGEQTGEPPDPNLLAAEFANYDGFNAQKAYELAHGIAEGDQSEDDDGSSTSSEEMAEEKRKRPINYWGETPEDLLARSDLEDSLDGSRAYVAHFVRYVMGMWQQHVEDGRKIEGNGLTKGTADSFNSTMVLEKTRESLLPLLVQLQQNTVPEELLRLIDTVVTLAAQRDYKTCMQEYMVITMGRKTWHQSLPQMMMQQNHGGSVCRIIKQSQFVDFDYDPTMNAYTVALKRVIQFLQWLRPATDISMGSYL